MKKGKNVNTYRRGTTTWQIFYFQREMCVCLVARRRGGCYARMVGGSIGMLSDVCIYRRTQTFGLDVVHAMHRVCLSAKNRFGVVIYTIPICMYVLVLLNDIQYYFCLLVVKKNHWYFVIGSELSRNEYGTDRVSEYVLWFE